MKKVIIISAVLMVFGIFFAVIFLENNKKSTSTLEDNLSMLEIGREFIDKASNGVNSEDEKRILGDVIDLDEVNVLNQARDFASNEEILDRGIRLTDAYNRIVYEFSAERISYDEYITKLYEYKIKYEKFLTAVDSYIGKEDILDLKNSMTKELYEMRIQIREFENSRSPDEEWKSVSEYEKYMDFLPSMFKDDRE